MKKYIVSGLMLLTILLTGCSAGKKDEDLTISLDSLTTEPTFISAASGKLDLEFIALKDEEGNLRLSYNTCQSCNGSPQAYFTYEDGIMTCQNCGLTFDTSVIGTASQGCNPIVVEGYEIEDGQVTISAELLSTAAKTYFTSWKDNAK